MHDVIIVGAGPAGCHAASLIARRGFDVRVIEEHQIIGEPVDCSGVVGAESFDLLGLPESLKLADIRSLTLFSPSGLDVRFHPDSPLAYVVDRSALDRAVADRASSAGAKFHLGCRMIDLHVSEDGVEVVVRKTFNVQRPTSVVKRQWSIVNGRSVGEDARKLESEESRKLPNLLASQLPSGYPLRDSRFTIHEDRLRARLVILACGPRYKIQRKLGMGIPMDFLRTAQVEVPVRNIEETRVLFGSDTAPGSFAWVVPFRRDGVRFARIGVSARFNPAPYLKKFLATLHLGGCLVDSEMPIRSWLIPMKPVKKSYAERVLAVGDAAGQNKPTTGGGIYYGLLSAEAAADTAVKALETGGFGEKSLRPYELGWRKKLGSEIRMGSFFRRLGEQLSDKDIDDIFRVVRSDGILNAIKTKARFDWHRDVIYFTLRHPELGRIFLRGMFR